MTDCPNGEMRDLLPEYAHGVLGAEDTARVAAHVAACDDCRAELALIGRVRESVTLGVPRTNVAAIVGALPAPRAASGKPALYASPRRDVAWKTWQYAAAAGLVLAVGSGVVWQRTSVGTGARFADSSQVRTSPAPAETTHATAPLTPEDGITFGGGLSDLSLNDLQALLGQMDSLKTLPSTDPQSVTPVIASNEGGKTL